MRQRYMTMSEIKRVCSELNLQPPQPIREHVLRYDAEMLVRSLRNVSRGISLRALRAGELLPKAEARYERRKRVCEASGKVVARVLDSSSKPV